MINHLNKRKAELLQVLLFFDLLALEQDLTGKKNVNISLLKKNINSFSLQNHFKQ